jgi:hypothetical protein
MACFRALRGSPCLCWGMSLSLLLFVLLLDMVRSVCGMHCVLFDSKVRQPPNLTHAPHTQFPWLWAHFHTPDAPPLIGFLRIFPLHDVMPPKGDLSSRPIPHHMLMYPQVIGNCAMASAFAVQDKLMITENMAEKMRFYVTLRVCFVLWCVSCLNVWAADIARCSSRINKQPRIIQVHFHCRVLSVPLLVLSSACWIGRLRNTVPD